jgi:hypothetical protein
LYAAGGADAATFHSSKGGSMTTKRRTRYLATGLEEGKRLAPSPRGGVAYSISRRGRYWEVCDSAGELVCLAVYKCGAHEVVRRLCV